MATIIGRTSMPEETPRWVRPEAGESVVNKYEKDVRASRLARAFVATNPEMVWADTSQRGYMMIDVTAQRVTGEWLFMQTIKSRSTALAGTHRVSAERGRRKFSA